MLTPHGARTHEGASKGAEEARSMDSVKHERLGDLRMAYEIKKERVDSLKADIQKMMDEGKSEAQIERCIKDRGLEKEIMRLRAVELEIEALEIQIKSL